MIYAVLDTNVVVSALISRNPQAATVRLFDAMEAGKLCPVYNHEILAEYEEVLNRPKFQLSPTAVSGVIEQIQKMGTYACRKQSDEYFPDIDDAVFYEVALSKADAYLVTGNIRHFPKRPIVVTPIEMIQIIENSHISTT